MADPTLVPSPEEMGRRRDQRKGYLYKKNGSWMLQWRSPHADAEGKRPKITEKIAEATGPKGLTKREAKRLAWDDKLSQLDKVSLHPGSSMTLKEFYEKRWKVDKISHLAPKSQKSYETQMINHILPTFGSEALKDISTPLVQDLVNRKVAWRDKDDKSLSPASIKAILVTMKACLNHAKKMDYLPGKMPTDGVTLPKERDREKRPLQWSQVMLIADSLPEPISTLVIFLSLTGLRIGEACGLRWEHVNLTADNQPCGAEILAPMTLAVRENWVMGKRQDLKTRKSRRDVPITAELARRLVALAASRDAERPVFMSSQSTPVDAHNIANRILKPLVVKMGLPWVSWHSFRHTNASLAERAGMTVSQRMMLLGHEDASTTRIYTHADVESARAALEKISIN